MNQIGRRIYYELDTGNVIIDTGERVGNVVETTIDQDFATYIALQGRVRNTVGVMQLEYGQFAQDFAECNGYRVNVSGPEPTLEFSYPDPNDPDAPPEYREPLSVEVERLKAENALIALELAQTQFRLDQAEHEQAELLLELVTREVI